MVNQNKVSIIIPCYNGENFIDRCMNSIITQNYPYVECIVVDDGSNDYSYDKIMSWKNKFDIKHWELKYFFQKNQGPGAAINSGLKLVSGRYIILLDVDDEYLPGALSEKVEYLDKHEDIYVVRSNGWMINGKNRNLFINDEYEKKNENIFEALLIGKTNNWAGSYMLRADKLFEFYPNREIYKSKYGQNLQLLLPLLYKRKCGYIDKPQMNYIRQENSLSNTNISNKIKEKALSNIQGYIDIRKYMVELIVKDDLEKKNLLKNIDIFYWKSVMSIAMDNKDKKLMKDAYKFLLNNSKITIDDMIVYTLLCCPPISIFLRIIRKFKGIILGVKKLD